MKLQLDFDVKSVTIEGDVNIADFIKQIKVLLPDYKKWDLITNVTISNWNQPYYIPHTPTTSPYRPWIPLDTTTGGTVSGVATGI